MKTSNKKLRTAIAMTLLILSAVLLLAGCSGKTKLDGSDQEVFVTFQGQKIHVGDSFSELSTKLGPEKQPAEEVKPCDPNSNEVLTLYFYDGIDITVSEDGTIDSISVTGGSTAVLQDKILIGIEADAVKNFFGKPSDENEYALTYDWGSVWGNIYLDEGAVSGFMLGRSVN